MFSKQKFRQVLAAFARFFKAEQQPLFIIIGIVCTAVFLIFAMYANSKPAGPAFSFAPPSISKSIPLPDSSDPLEELPDGMIEQYGSLYLQNQDLIGWLQITGTQIDYPVMQTLGDNEYYLRLNFDKEYALGGSLFMEERCNPLRPSTNQIIYGHNMPDGTMFGELKHYEKKSFYEDHPQIAFDTLYTQNTYQIMAVFRSRVYYNTDDVFKYYYFFNATSQEEWDYYYSNVKQLSLYDTGVTAEYGDKFLTLSTCDDEGEYGRFVVVAKLMQ